MRPGEEDWEAALYFGEMGTLTDYTLAWIIFKTCGLWSFSQITLLLSFKRQPAAQSRLCSMEVTVPAKGRKTGSWGQQKTKKKLALFVY